MNILISGADGNLGSAVVDKLMAENHNVFGLFAHEDKAENDNRDFEKFSADLMNPEEADKAVSEMQAKFQGIDGAVLTVGGFAMGSIENTSIDDIEKQIKLNFNTSYNLVKPLLSKMSKGGQIFLIGARPATDAAELKDKLAYGLAKRLVFTLAEVINADRKDTGIQCKVIVPSIIDTPPNRKSMPDMDFSKWVKPTEIADTIYFHLTHNYIKEAVIKVYGEV